MLLTSIEVVHLCLRVPEEAQLHPQHLAAQSLRHDHLRSNTIKYYSAVKIE